MNWVVSHVQSISFFVLINGSTSPFFRARRGLRQGWPLSPLLFILVMEGLSITYTHTHSNGFLRGIIVGGNVSITHLLFVDDILLFFDGSRRNISKIISILALFKCTRDDYKCSLIQNVFHALGTWKYWLDLNTICICSGQYTWWSEIFGFLLTTKWLSLKRVGLVDKKNRENIYALVQKVVVMWWKNDFIEIYPGSYLRILDFSSLCACWNLGKN